MSGTIVVWVLLIVTSGSHLEASVAVVDNIASQANCKALADHVRNATAYPISFNREVRCVAVRKARP